MSAAEHDIRSFAEFVGRQLSEGGSDLTLDELFDMWRAANPVPDELARSVAAVKAAISDMEAGDTGTSVSEHLAGPRSRFNIPESE